MIYLSVKEKEKYVVELRKQDKRKRRILSKTAKALQLYKNGKSPIQVAIKLDLDPKEAQSIYTDYLSLNNLQQIVETFKQFDNESLQDYINLFHLIKKEEIDKKEIVETIKMINDYPRINEEYHDITKQLKDLRRQRDFYLSDNKILIWKNCELNKEYNSLVSKIGSDKRILQITENELNKKRNLLDTIKNSEDYAILKKQIGEQINNFLNQKKEFFKLAVMTILKIIKQDPKKEILINNILHSDGNLDSEFYLDLHEEKIVEITANTLSDIVLEINTNNILD